MLSQFPFYCPWPSNFLQFLAESIPEVQSPLFISPLEKFTYGGLYDGLSILQDLYPGLRLEGKQQKTLAPIKRK